MVFSRNNLHARAARLGATRAGLVSASHLLSRGVARGRKPSPSGTPIGGPRIPGRPGDSGTALCEKPRCIQLLSGFCHCMLDVSIFQCLILWNGCFSWPQTSSPSYDYCNSLDFFPVRFLSSFDSFGARECSVG